MTTEFWIRIGLLAVLGLCAAGRGALVLGVFGMLLALGIHWVGGQDWPLSILAGLAAGLVLPVLGLQLKNARFLVLACIVFGGPAVLISHLLCGSTWPWASADAVCFVVLGPVALLRVLLMAGVIRKPEPAESQAAEPARPAASSSRYSALSNTLGAKLTDAPEIVALAALPIEELFEMKLPPETLMEVVSLKMKNDPKPNRTWISSDSPHPQQRSELRNVR